MVKSAFHIEESLFRNHDRSIDNLQVQLSVRPKSHEELRNYQNSKIQILEEQLQIAWTMPSSANCPQEEQKDGRYEEEDKRKEYDDRGNRQLVL